MRAGAGSPHLGEDRLAAQDDKVTTAPQVIKAPQAIKVPWRDRAGRFSALKATCFAALFLPGLWVLGQALIGTLGPRPVTEAIHELGLWTIRLLFLALAITARSRRCSGTFKGCLRGVSGHWLASSGRSRG